MIKIGNNEISKIYLGSDEVSKAYVGSNVVYEVSSGGTDYSKEYFTIEAISAGTVSWNVDNLEYSLNDGAWTSWNASLAVSDGDTVKFRRTNTELSANTVSSTANFDVYGNVMSLFYGDNFSAVTSITVERLLQKLFAANTHLVNAENLVLPATTLAENCYDNMFSGCTSLTTAPELPATTLATNCYRNMFQRCSSLTTAPELPATSLAGNCYTQMFKSCTSLTTAPELPATTMPEYCYTQMFSGCTSLTTAPELPATSLAGNCYKSMFQACTSLATAPALPATSLANNCYQNMFYGCTSLVQAPTLPATTLTSNCYNSMFRSCSNLNYIECLATDISANACTTYWLNGVASSGTFVKATSMSSWTTGGSGIPDGWTVEDYDVLPNVPYLCNYNAKNFDANTQTFYRSESGQTLDYDLSGFSDTLALTNDYVSFTTKMSSYPNVDGSLFNRDANNTTFTAIYKAAFNGNTRDLVGNRNDTYNWMIRRDVFHTSQANYLNFIPSVSPATIVIRVDSNGNGERKCIETNQVATGQVSWGGASSKTYFFCEYYYGFSNQFLGDFYWMYISNNYLTDEQVQKVIDYNENKQPNANNND